MPASLRAHVSRGSSSSRPYDRCSPTASPAQSENPYLFSRVSPASPIHRPYPEPYPSKADADPDADTDTPPDHPGLPTYAEYKRIEADYLYGLSPRKRDKALITQAMFDKIWEVLHQPDACTIETPQFRFWVRKMFTLARPTSATMGMGMGMGMGATGTYTNSDSDSDGEEAGLELERAMGIGRAASASDLVFTAVVLHESRPVAIMEQLYELFCYCHVRAGHGGRDKTCAVIRQHYSWVPKELTAQFVKACPTCALKRSGHGGVSVGVGVDMGLVQRRAVGQRERKGRGRAEEIPLSVVPSSLGSVGWPTTGGPLDPANPEPCGVRKREREREWLRGREDARTVSPSSPVSPARGSRTQSVPREVPLEGWSSSGWCNVVPRALTLDTSPFPPCDPTHSSALPQPFAVELENSSRTRSDREEKRSPTKTTELPSLASALSNESLDENVNLTGLEPELCAASGGGDVGGHLPPALRPLRLSGPVPSTDAESDLPPLASSSSSYFFQIDPVLLSFNYPGTSESGFASCPGADAKPLCLSMSTGIGMLPSDSEQGRGRPMNMNSTCFMPNVATGLYGRLRAPSGSDPDVDVESIDMPALETSDLDRSTIHSDSPDSSFDSAAASTTYGASGVSAKLPLSLSTELAQTSRYGSRYGYRDHGSLAMLLSCSTDEVGQELDGALSFSIMTDA